MELLPVLDFIEFCLLPYLSHKEIQLIQLKVTQARPKQKDLFYLQCYYYQKALKLVRRYKKNAPNPFQHSDSNLYSLLTKLDPEDILLTLTPDRYKISEDALPIIIGKPIESLRFRRNQIIDQFYKDGLKSNFQQLTQIPLNELSTSIAIQQEITSSNSLQEGLSRISKIPAPLKFVLEMGLVLVLLFFIMWLVPQIRNTYENSVQKRINEYLIDASLTDSPPPAGIVKPKPPETQPTEPTSNLTGTEETLAPAPETTAIHKQPKVSEGETWRFSFTGQGQADLDSQLAEIIESKTKQKIKPLVVPGGIQYEFLLPTTLLIPLKIEFEQLTNLLQRKSATQVSTAGTPSSMVNMSWYKKRNLGQRKIPSGNVLAIIWISTL